MPRNEADTRATAVETQDFASLRTSLRTSLQDHPELAAYTETITAIFTQWRDVHRPRLMALTAGDRPRDLIETLSEALLQAFSVETQDFASLQPQPRSHSRKRTDIMEKYRGKYRIPSARWATWDYGSNAAYFVTICIDDRTHDFGEVVDGEMVLTPLGQAATDCWQAIPDHFPFVVLDGFVAMPNHVHGIIIIDKPDGGGGDGPNRFGPQSKNLASIVRGYKIGVTKFARQHNIAFQWQARYHDHVIRNTGEYERIRKYIDENPQKWAEDRYYAPSSS